MSPASESPQVESPQDGEHMVHIDVTRTEMTQLLLPGQTNNHGNAFGGQIMAWCDICAAVAAQRFCRGEVVTASMDQLAFRKPVKSGMVVVLRAQVNRSWGTSMEVGVRVEAEDPKVGRRVHCCSAYLTFVHLDENGRPASVPRLDPGVDGRRFDEAQARREARLSLRDTIRAQRAQRER